MQTPRPFLHDLAKTIGCFADNLSVWQDRCRERRALMRLSERSLKDLGISRGQALTEFEKPFWQD